MTKNTSNVYYSEEYKKKLISSELFFPGFFKGSFILPANGFSLWQNIKKEINKNFSKLEVKEVLLPSFIPISILKLEQQHIKGFEPELFFIKNNENKVCLRPTSEVLFYSWYRQILQSYNQLPFLFHQWCSAFRVEKNTNTLFRNTEFYWQEGHSIHSSAEEAKKIIKKIYRLYKTFFLKTLNLSIISGKKTNLEKFAGAIETFTFETLLPDGQCLQLATIHYFGDSFCKSLKVKFLNKENKTQAPFSVSWGISTRIIGAITKAHEDKYGIILPFKISTTQIAFILTQETKEIKKIFNEINNWLKKKYFCKLYNKHQQIFKNLLEADEHGCSFKIIIGEKELKEKRIILSNRATSENILISLNKKDIILILKEEIKKSNEFLLKKNILFIKKNTFEIENTKELKEKLLIKINFLFFNFCGDLNCEIKDKKILENYSFRCLQEKNKNKKKNVFFATN